MREPKSMEAEIVGVILKGVVRLKKAMGKTNGKQGEGGLRRTAGNDSVDRFWEGAVKNKIKECNWEDVE